MIALNENFKGGDMMAMAALIGGTGVYDPRLLENPRQQSVRTPYGFIEVDIGTYDGLEIVFLPRHGKGHSIPPHKINYRANMWGLKQLGVTHVIGTAAVGSLNPAMEPGHFVIVDQFIDFTKTQHTFYDGTDDRVVHTDVTDPYCRALRRRAEAAAQQLGLTTHAAGVYLCVEGPRYETAAEIRMFRQWGADVIGMTNAPEVILAREIGLCYAAVATVTNMAAGISETPLSHDEVSQVMAANTEHVRSLAFKVLSTVGADPCHCPESQS